MPRMPRLELVETSLRHGQQSLLVSRLRLRHALPVAERLDACGFAALSGQNCRYYATVLS